MKKNKSQKNIPEGWRQVKLGDICVFKKGKGLPKSEMLQEGENECIHYGELFIKYDEKINKILSFTNSKKDKMFLSEVNDILMPTSDVTPRGLSTASCITKRGVILGGDVLVIRCKNKKLNGLFFSYYVNARKRDVIKLVSGTTVFHLYGSDMARFKLLLPSLSEQNRIVEVLETWDKYLEELSKKIEIKKKIKKGLMQKFIYKRKDVNNILISDIFNLGRGRVISKNEIKDNIGNYPVYSSQTSSSGILGKINTHDFEGDYITWTTDGANAGRVYFRQGKFNCTNVCGTAKLKNDKSANLYYIASYLNNITNRYVSYVGNPKLMNGVFGSIKIKLPSLKEQQAIAKVLTVADREIEVLEKKKNIIEAQKKYLLNNLITGKIRVPV
ncbi:restriction endonuclease subunit S [bacterium]|nr:restriction endonuclease subunit S [bacterium]